MKLCTGKMALPLFFNGKGILPWKSFVEVKWLCPYFLTAKGFYLGRAS
jgi:hypothetical protein